MYKAPPPEVSSEQFYETDASRGFARGFSIQTVSPLPIGWAEHVLADGHRGAALREYMRDYNHWAVLGALCELLPLPDNRVTLADETDQYGMPIARFDYTQCDNDRANIAFAKQTLHDDLGVGGRPGRAHDRPLRAPRRRLPDGRTPGDERRRRRPPRLGTAEPVRLRRQRDADAGERQPGAHDHGAGVAAGRAAGRRPCRGRRLRAPRCRCTREVAPARARGRRRHRRIGRRRPGDRPRVRPPGRVRRPARARPHGLSDAAREVEELGGTALVLPTDVADPDAGRGRRRGGRGAVRAHRRVGQRRDGHDLRARRRDHRRGVRARHRGHLPGHRLRHDGGACGG